MCNNSNPVDLLRETVIQSERDGAQRLYTSPSSTFRSFEHGTALDFEWFVHSVLNGPTVELYAQISADGKSWEDLPNVAQRGFLGTNISSTSAGSRGQFTSWVGGMLSKASFVRFGVQINGTGSQAEMSLTLTVTPRVAGGDVFITDDYQIDNVDQPTDINGPVIDVRDAKVVTLYGSAVFNSGTNTTADFELYTSNKSDGTYTATGVKVQLVQPTADPSSGVDVAGGENSNFMSYVKVFQVPSAATESDDATLTMYATVRPNC